MTEWQDRNFPFDRQGRSPCHGLPALQLAARALVQHGTRELLLQTPDLEPERFDDADFAHALSLFVRSSRYAQACILIGQAQPITLSSHALIRLHQRMPSRVQLRQVCADDVNNQRELWLDGCDGLRVLQGNPTWQGWLYRHSAAAISPARDLFWQRWQRAKPAPELRQFVL